MGKLYVGWAEESLVPEKKVSLAGQFFERISEYVESDITATAMAVEADGEQMVMVSVDVVSLSEGVIAYARENSEKLTLIGNSLKYASKLPADFARMLIDGYKIMKPGYSEILSEIPEYITFNRSRGESLNGRI